MKGLDTGKERIQKICDALRKETMEPAKQEAREVIENAHMQAAEMLKKAREEANRLTEKTDQEIERKKEALQSSLRLACRQGIEELKQAIEKDLFFKEMHNAIISELSLPKVVSEVVNRCIDLLEKEGIQGEISATIPQQLSPRAINELIYQKNLARLKEKSVVLGEFSGGAKIKLHDKHMTLEITDQTIKDLLFRYLREDFRELVFGA